MKAVLNDDDDSRRVTFSKWKAGKLKSNIHPKHMIDYKNSPPPPKKMG
jgi:hypothetical protein